MFSSGSNFLRLRQFIVITFEIFSIHFVVVAAAQKPEQPPNRYALRSNI